MAERQGFGNCINPITITTIPNSAINETEQRNHCYAVKETIHELRKLLKDKENELCSFIETKQQSKHYALMRQLHVKEDQLSVIDCGVSCIEISNQIVGEEDPFGFVSFRVPSIHAAASRSQFPSTKTLPLVASAPLEASQLDCNDLTSAIKALKLLPSVDATHSKIARLNAGPVFRYEEPQSKPSVIRDQDLPQLRTLRTILKPFGTTYLK
ncbi:hypothetical protein Pelo_18936 [Pelomyxa schiedti]|nr:hypothetical protein Pelo_18936 [Pelomyxa schiedti]